MQGDADLSRQYVSALSILFIALFIGLPIWWKTTEVYRCPLPYTEINNLTHQQVPKQFSFQVFTAILGKEDTQLEAIVTKLQQHLSPKTVLAGDTKVKVHYVVKALRPDVGSSSRLSDAAASKSYGEFSSLVKTLLPPSTLGHYSIFLAPRGEGQEGGAKKRPQMWVSRHRHAVVETAVDVFEAIPMVVELVTSVYGDTQLLQKVLTSSAGKQQDRADVESMRQLRATQGYQISFTLLNPDPSQLKTDWNIKEITDTMLLPFLRHPGIASLGNFTVNSQVLYYTDVKLRPKKVKSHYVVSSTQLPPMISSVESKLGSVVSQYPTLNFLVYVPKKSEHPLHIRDASSKDSDAFLVPQWGGVVIYNPLELAGSVQDKNTSVQDTGTRPVLVRMEELMPVFIGQLKMLLGVPLKVPEVESFQFATGSNMVADWQVDKLLISKMAESISMATGSLISLVQLLDKVKNMVISDHIQQEVLLSLHSIQKCYQLAAESDLEGAYISAKKAMLSAEAAFFDPSILELLYFPDDQKFAIYIPLFLPISIPIALSSVAAFKWVLKTLKSRTATKSKQE